MKKAAVIVGARPQFIKTAPLIIELARHFDPILIHTGQHYDYMMSDNFFSELNLPDPDYHLNTPGGSHGRQTGRMIEGLESVFSFEKPDLAIVIGDTNSTLAGSIAASKLNIPVVHVEAGVRSKDRNLPEQINRVVTDSIASFYLCPTPSSVKNLNSEGKLANVFDTGDILYDCLRLFEDHVNPGATSIANLPSRFVLATIHRADAVDNSENLETIIKSLNTCPFPIVFPVHPRTRKKLSAISDVLNGNIMFTDPVGYNDLLSLIKGSEFVITDSGGVQRESAYLKKQVILARDETEWVELVELGWVTIAGYDFDLKLFDLSPKSKNDELDYLTRPASKAMIEIIKKA